ncbi:MAG TPA: ABC transporter ATP-binding protein, partial [Alcanivorax sp.]|nr:ABC transporter ATP-binding protein [Alcanivorax sp.]
MSALSIKGLTKNFGPAEVICGVDLDVAENEVHAVIGPNGAGKS